jgi:hypothetical protein
MEWTKPLSFALAVVVAALAVGSAYQLGNTTLAGEYVVAAGATLVLLVVLVAAAIAVGAKDRQWLDNPDSYF